MSKHVLYQLVGNTYVYSTTHYNPLDRYYYYRFKIV